MGAREVKTDATTALDERERRASTQAAPKDVARKPAARKSTGPAQAKAAAKPPAGSSAKGPAKGPARNGAAAAKPAAGASAKSPAKPPARNGAAAAKPAAGASAKSPAKPAADPPVRSAPPPPRPTPPARTWDADELAPVLSASARRAALVEAAARLADGPARPRVSPAAPVRARPAGPRFAALVASVALLAPLAVLTLVVKASAPTVTMSSADASFLGEQLLTADARVRSRLVRLRDSGTAPALIRTRDAILTTRSLAIEMRSIRGAEADRLRNAMALERAWLDAVGSTLSNPRSPLRARLLERDAAVRRALADLPTGRMPRTDGAHSLVKYARSRERATPAGSRD